MTSTCERCGGINELHSCPRSRMCRKCNELCASYVNTFGGVPGTSRVKNVLKAIGVFNDDELIALSASSIMAQRNCGPATYEKISSIQEKLKNSRRL